MEPWERNEEPEPSDRSLLLQLVLLVVAAGAIGIGVVVALATMWSGPFSPFLGLGKSEIYMATFGVGFFALVFLAVVRAAERDRSNDPRSGT